MRIARRLDLDGAVSHSLRLLIEQHLSMAMISQRRDLEDPAVIRQFASQVQTPENLKMLTLLTFVDSLATSDKLWNGFKDTLLWQLHHKTMQLFLGGTIFISAEEKQRELLAQEISHLLPKSFGHEELEAHFTTLPPRYFQITPEKEILTDLTLVHRFMHHQIDEEDRALEPVLVWHNEPDRGYTSVRICTWDRAGLFSKITGCLSSAGINILSAQIFTRTDGIVLDNFFVTDAISGSMVARESRDRFENILFESLSTSDEVDYRPLIHKQGSARPLYQSVEGERIPTRIHFDNDTSETRTVIDVETEDRVGLLYVISQALTECGLDIALAKILTEKGAAIDTFYVCEEDTQKVLFPDRQHYITSKIRSAIAGLDK